MISRKGAEPVDLGVRARLAIYEHFAAGGTRPSLDDVAARPGAAVPDVR